MDELTLIEQGIAEAVRICAASRTFRQAERWPRVVKGCVAFHEGDQRFRIYDATTLYVGLYLKDEAAGLDLGAALKDEHHVRELIEVITS